ncbi:MAG TPA: glycosyltransferase family 2 protein [Acidimicrobiales bacterium]|nr:glycosyltransferase family 2 protein [Acidimicrobiales bacterium]
MPTYNEARTLERAVRSVLALQLPYRLELIVVDDGSTDHTPVILSDIEDERLIVHAHPANLGKGAAVLTGAALATGTHLVVFDADAEYQARDLVPMADAILSGRASVVFGTRLFGVNSVYQSFHHALGNKMATLAANVIFNSYLSDMHTCLKMVPVALFRELRLSSKGFGLDTEITGELLRRGYRPFEVPISYVSRSREEGKKLVWWDGVDCLMVLLKVRLRGKVRRSATAEPTAIIDLVEAAQLEEDNRVVLSTTSSEVAVSVA